MVKTFVAVSIDPEFRDLNHNLTEEEFSLLAQQIVKDGCQDALIAWDHPGNPLLDGHNRYKICTEEDLPYKVVLLSLPDRDACIDWIIRRQLGRRNSSDEQKRYLRGKLYRHHKQDVGRPKTEKLAQSEPILSQGQDTSCENAKTLAAQTGVSVATLKRDAAFSEAVDKLAEKSPELRDAAIKGEIPTSTVPALAATPKKKLQRLKKLKGKELREAARDVAEERAEEAAEEPEPEDDTAEGAMKQTNSEIEIFCRGLLKFAEENMPSDPWIKKDGRGDQAMQKIRDACATLRSCKCSAVCPKCDGEGCAKCLDTGRVTRYALEQMS